MIGQLEEIVTSSENRSHGIEIGEGPVLVSEI